MAAVAAAAVVLDEQEHRLLRRACSDVAAVLLSEVVGAEVEAEVRVYGPHRSFLTANST